MKAKINLLLSFSFILAAPVALFAQVGAPPGTPIDGGLGILLAAGGVYAYKKIKSSKKS